MSSLFQAMGTSQSRDKAEVHVASAAQQQATDSSCPVPEQYRNPAVYNVYSERVSSSGQAFTSSSPASLPSGWGRLDPRNNMPAEANQQPCAGQRRLISTDRMASSIRKGGTDTTWVYPSPQMFYNGEPARLSYLLCCFTAIQAEAAVWLPRLAGVCKNLLSLPYSP